MKTVDFNGYSVGSPRVTIAVDRITHWWQIDYNGQYGTEIELDTGKTVRVRAWPHDVQKAVENAQA